MIKNEPGDIKRTTEKLYGIYRGVVVNNNDSGYNNNERYDGGAGRVQVRIWGVHTNETDQDDHTGIPDNHLPWAEPAYPVIEGSLEDVGIWSVPVEGTHVFVFFENGDHMRPRYFACVPGISEDTPDYSRTARGMNTGNFIAQMNGDLLERTLGDCIEIQFLETEYTIGSYPDILSLETHGGHALTFDSSDEKQFYLYHPGQGNKESGNRFFSMSINNEGKLKIHGRYGAFIAIEKQDVHKYIEMDEHQAVEGNRNEYIGENWKVEVKGSVEIYAETIKLAGSTCGANAKPLATSEHTHTCSCGGTTDGPSKYTEILTAE